MIDSRKKLVPRGSLYKHSKTGGWYLRVRWPDETEFSSVPLRPPGAKSATKVKGVAVEIAKDVIAVRLSHREGITDSLVDLAEQFRSANTLTAKPLHAKKNKAHIMRFLKEAEIEQVEAITTMAVRAFLVKLGETLSPKTIREYKTSINLFCTFLVERQLLAYNPCTVVKLRPIKPRPPVLMPTASVEALRERITTSESSYREDLLLAVDIAAHCGLRISEILELRHRALLDQGEGFALLVGEKSPTKSGDWR
ncbi:MAG: hypothetical protein HN370_09225, partial [Phycisphaerales bacterium]|nr:hypothetical protein [Phycisphaerales bacterium]